MSIEVSGLYVYPVKGCAGIALDEMSFTERGPAYDREWMVVGSRGQFLTQRVHPELALVHTALDDRSLTLTAPGMDDLALGIGQERLTGEEVEVEVFKKPGSGVDQGKEAAEYFSDFLRRPARLLRVKRPRQVKPECQVDSASRTMGFADGFPLTLASTTSLDTLNKSMEVPITIDRFRPNIVVSGADLPPFAEDSWREVEISGLSAFIVRACSRCPVPNIDQQRGILPKPADRTVTRVLRDQRSGVDPVSGSRGEFFMQNLVYELDGKAVIRIGDNLQVVRRADRPNIEFTASN